MLPQPSSISPHRFKTNSPRKRLRSPKNRRRLAAFDRQSYQSKEQKSTIHAKSRRKWQSVNMYMRNIILAGCAKIATTNQVELNWPLTAHTRTGSSTRGTCARAATCGFISAGTNTRAKPNRKRATLNNLDDLILTRLTCRSVSQRTRLIILLKLSLAEVSP